MEDTATLYAIGFFVAALIIFFLEVVIPSGGILGLTALLCTLAGVVSLYFVSLTAGMIGTVAALILIPIMVTIALRVMPNTYFVKRLILNDEQDPDSVRYEASRDTDPKKLVGTRGVTVDALRPVGTCKLGPDRLECLAISGVIEPNTMVEVVSVDGLEIRVKAVEG